MKRDGGRALPCSVIFTLLLAFLLLKVSTKSRNNIYNVDINLLEYQYGLGGCLRSHFMTSWFSHPNHNLKRRRKIHPSKRRILHHGDTSTIFVFYLISGDVELNPGMSRNVSEVKSTKRPVLQRNIQIAHLNARSIKNREHFTLAKELVLKNQFDVFTVSETWFDDTVQNLDVEIPCYNIYRLDRSDKVGGGVCAYVKNCYKVERLNELSNISTNGLHQLWLKIQARNCKSFLICTVYRPPNVTLNCFDEDLADTIITAFTSNKDFYILGDLNCDFLSHSSQTLQDFCSAFNLTQIIKKPTRITQNSATLIDVILTSNTNMIQNSDVMPCSISDHDLVYAQLRLKKDRPKPVYITARSFKNFDADAFQNDIANAPWCAVDVFDDVDDKLNTFHLIFNDILDCHAPIKNIKIRSRPNPYVNEEIRSLMRTRDHWQKLARKTNDALAWSGYKFFKREVKRELRIAEREYLEEQIRKNPNDTRSMWKTIRSCIPKKSACRKTYIKDEKTVANEFNSFFTSVGQSAIQDINTLAEQCNYDLTNPSFVPRNYTPEQQFSFKQVDCKEIEKVINSMPVGKAPGNDKITARILKCCLSSIAPILTTIINASLTSSTFPLIWKTAEVIPILKDGDHEKPENNRPISLLPILSKVCERIALNQFVPYLESNQRLSSTQSGNKKFHSTETSLIHTTDVVLEAIDKKKTTAVVLLDMSKAFDSIHHNILLDKLRDVGVSIPALRWFNSYLTNRNQMVRINSTISDVLPLVSGVPQGSIMGPLLFTIYVNDLSTVSRNCSTECYVDDTKVYMSFNVKDCDNAIAAVNEDLHNIRNWCFGNGLLLNPQKTKLIVYGSRQMREKLPEFQLSLLGKNLVPVDSVKDLGVTFDKYLTFNEHTTYTVSACISALAQISRVKHIFKNELITIINALVFSKLFYCSSVWSNTTISNINKLQKVQNFAARIVCNKRKYDHITPVLKNLRWLPVKTYLYYRDAVLAFKCMTGNAPNYLCNKFISRGDISKRNTRYSQLLNIPIFKTKAGQRSFSYRIVDIWNNLSSNLKLSKNVQNFKVNLRKHLLNQFLSSF